MFVTHEYQVSIFGQFISISQDSETVYKLLGKLKKYKVVPQLIPTSFMSNPNISIPNPPMIFTTQPQDIRIIISSERIDVTFTTKGKEQLAESSIRKYQNDACDILNSIIDVCNLSVDRLALNTMDLDIDELANKINTSGRILKTEIPSYDEKNGGNLVEWGARLMKRGKLKTESGDCQLNIITTIDKTKVTVNNLKPVDGLTIRFDINTAVDPKSSATYTKEDIKTFVIDAEKIKSTIQNEILGEIK